MQEINLEIGSVYDTVTYLSMHFSSASNDVSKMILDKLTKKNVVISDYFSPFFTCSVKNNNFIMNSILENIPIDSWSLKQITKCIANKRFFKRAFINYYFDFLDCSAIKKLEEGTNLEIASIVLDTNIDDKVNAYILNAILNFSDLSLEFEHLFTSIYEIVHELSTSLLKDTFLSRVTSIDVLSKLKAIGNIDDQTKIIVVPTILREHEIKNDKNCRGFFVLGLNFEFRLSTEFKYHDINIVKFALCIDNEIKYKILKTLLQHGSLNITELASINRYETNRSLRYNANSMVRNGLLIAEKLGGKEKYYKVDFGFMSTITRQIDYFISKNRIE